MLASTQSTLSFRQCSGPLKLSAVAASVALCLVLPVQSVDAQESAAPAGVSLEEIVVTGSRIRQRDDYVSPNPVSTFDAQRMENLGLINIADVITQVPQNTSQFQAATTGGSAFFIGSTLANLRGLNPFFGTRTLTLVDSRRFIPTTQGDSVDVNFVPAILISRTEVVTGGASAAYGSGAVSGVVNILLDRSLQGVKLEVDFGATGQGDGDDVHVGIAGGSSFANGRGHFVAGAEFQNSDVIQDCSTARDWCARGRGLFNNNTGFSFGAGDPVTPKIPGQPAEILVDNLRQNQVSHTGVIHNGAPGATSTLQFNSAGTDVAPFAIGGEGWRGTGGSVVGGDGESIYKNLSLYPEIERKVLFGHASFDFTDTVTGFFETSWGEVIGVNHQWAPGQNTAFACIRGDNAYLSTLSPAAQAALAASVNNAPFSTFPNSTCGDFTGGALPFLNATTIAKDWSDQNDQTVTTDTTVQRFVVGLEGAMGDNWSWDVYYQYGETERDQIGEGYRTNWRYDMALDAIIDPRPGLPTSGQPICRVTLTGLPPGNGVGGFGPPVADPSLINGCQPLNPFGLAASQAALDYAWGDLTESNVIRQDVYAGTISGQLWEGWSAGPLMGAFGLEYRSDRLVNSAGDLPRPQRTDFGLQYGDSFGGETKVKEAFMELEMPFLRDRPGAEMLMLNVAARRSEYENIGGFGTTGEQGTQTFTTWKAAGVYDPVQWLRFRASRSRDLRAASFRELYYSQSIPPGGFFGSVQNPWLTPADLLFLNQTMPTDASWLILAGSPTLEPEIAETETIGFVVSPGGGAEGLQFSVDYYEINLDGGQRLDFAPSIVSQCFDFQLQCEKVVFGPPTVPTNPMSNIEEVIVPYINAAPYTAKGVDFSFDYPLQLANGVVSFNLTATHAIDLLFQNTVTLQSSDVAGQSGGGFGFLPDVAPAPEWVGNLIVSWLRGPFALTGQARYTGSGKLDLLTPRTGPGEPGYDPTLTGSVTDANVPSHVTYNLTGSYDFDLSGLERLNVFLSINNVFDKDPPFSANNAFGVGGVNGTFFDTLGRTYRLGARMTF